MGKTFECYFCLRGDAAITLGGITRRTIWLDSWFDSWWCSAWLWWMRIRNAGRWGINAPLVCSRLSIGMADSRNHQWSWVSTCIESKHGIRIYQFHWRLGKQVLCIQPCFELFLVVNKVDVIVNIVAMRVSPHRRYLQTQVSQYVLRKLLGKVVKRHFGWLHGKWLGLWKGCAGEVGWWFELFQPGLDGVLTAYLP